MKLSISNIAWSSDHDYEVYNLMKCAGYAGLEIAPTRIFPDNPYSQLTSAKDWALNLNKEFNLVIPSMQSIWYWRSEKVFGSDEERESLINYTKSAIDFAATIGCKNLVFGCPKNREVLDGCNIDTVVTFFRIIGDYAYSRNTVIGMEANPKIYNTNFINTTAQALDLIKKVSSKGFKLNLDIGTIIENGEKAEVIKDHVSLISHVHVSEPYLKTIKIRDLHKEIQEILKNENYQNFVSIEMAKQDDLKVIEDTISYVKNIFS